MGTELFLSALSLAFGLWAGVVAWGVRRISSQLDGMTRELKNESKRLNEYIVQTERRLSVLEDRVYNHLKDYPPAAFNRRSTDKEK